MCTDVNTLTYRVKSRETYNTHHPSDQWFSSCLHESEPFYGVDLANTPLVSVAGCTTFHTLIVQYTCTSNITHAHVYTFQLLLQLAYEAEKEKAFHWYEHTLHIPSSGLITQTTFFPTTDQSVSPAKIT